MEATGDCHLSDFCGRMGNSQAVLVERKGGEELEAVSGDQSFKQCCCKEQQRNEAVAEGESGPKFFFLFQDGRHMFVWPLKSSK